MFITDIKAPKGARKRKRVVGRGVGSGRGKTSGRGNKGQGSRSGRHFRLGYEGGQTMLFRRLPKRGFTSRQEAVYQIINVGDLNRFSKGAIVSADNLYDEGLIKNKDGMVKLLGDGVLNKALSIKVHKATESAVKKVQDASGTVEFINGKK
ncbi:MAG TPA: 50S ribosomal protein L15 [Candidatus Omnitrophota bacterium]|nr:50S ribosomal protein L15 [Candidatus Omnitrophota bacterium]